METGEQRIPSMYRIRYTKLQFCIEFLDNTEVPSEKAWTIRAGMGEMLLRANCVGGRRCVDCGYESECIVQKTMYSRFKGDTTATSVGESANYILFCGDHNTTYAAGDQMRFTLTLFGKAIVYFTQYLNALRDLGMSGMGKNRSRFRIVTITNMSGEVIYDGRILMLQKFSWSTVGEYIRDRKKQIIDQGCDGTLVFQTPLIMKYQGEYQQDFVIPALRETLLGRIDQMVESEELGGAGDNTPESAFPSGRTVEVKAEEGDGYSTRRAIHMKLHGIQGTLQLHSLSDDWADLLLAGELLQIGRDTFFGYGRYVLR